jgi:putative sigma-54 modulation protein
MNTNVDYLKITGRNLEITDAIRDYIETRVEAIVLNHPTVLNAHVILEVQKHLRSCEIILHAKSHVHYMARHKADDLYASVDLCVDKLDGQLRKLKTRILKIRRNFLPYQTNSFTRSAQACTGMRFAF